MRKKAILQLEVGNVWIKVSAGPNLLARINSILEFPVPEARFSELYQKKIWDGKKRFFKESSRVFQAGLLPYVLNHLPKDQIKVRFLDKRVLPFDIEKYKNRTKWPKISVEEWQYELDHVDFRADSRKVDYQVRAINDSLHNSFLGEHWPRGVIASATGCHALGAKILMSDGSVKSVEDVLVGDWLASPSGPPKKVLRLCRGKSVLYKVTPVKGDSFVVNEDHILPIQKYLKTVKEGFTSYSKQLSSMVVSDWENLTDSQKHERKIYRSSVQFEPSDFTPKISPYFLGILLGDGSLSQGVLVTASDPEIVKEIYDVAESFGLKVRVGKKDSSCDYCFSGIIYGQNSLLTEVRRLGINCLSKDKFIPPDYLTSSRDHRLHLLAGLTDGYSGSGSVEFSTASKRLCQDFLFLSRSLGFASYSSTKKVKAYPDNDYFRVSLSGDLSLIPTRVSRKKGLPRLQKKSVLVTGFSVQKVGFGDFFGFELGGDHLYLTDDFTVHHNSGKSLLVAGLIKTLNLPVLFTVHRLDLINQTREVFGSILGKNNIGQVGGGKFQLDKKITLSSIQTLSKKCKTDPRLRKFLSHTPVWVVDESHLVADNAYYKVSNLLIRAYYRYGLTGSAFKKSLISNMYARSVFGEEIFSLKSQKLIEDGLLARPIINMVEGAFSSPNSARMGSGASKMEARRLNTSEFEVLYRAQIVENEERNMLISRISQECVSNGEKVLVLVSRVNHGDILQGLMSPFLPCQFVSGRDSVSVRDLAVKKFQSPTLSVLIVSTIFDTGRDIPGINTIILAGAGSEPSVTIQRVGRGLRMAPGKTHCMIYDFNDRVYPFDDQVKDRLKCFSDEGWEVVFREVE